MIAKILEDLEVSKKSLFLKYEIELILTQSYQMICKLRNMSMEQTLTIEEVNMVEDFFMLNVRELENISIKDTYLRKYASQIFNFFQSYEDYLGRTRSKGKFNLFQSMKNKDVNIRGYSDVECAKILKLLEMHWVASNQIYTIFEIKKIKKNL